MLFNSIEFSLFLPVVFVLYWFVFNKSLRWQNVLILTASYFFYGWWSWKFLGVLILSTVLDYLYGFWVASPNKKKAKLFLCLSIINNLGMLGVFKYYDFFVTEFQKGFELIGIHVSPLLLNIALPIGISFYTFHGMSYVFDIYRAKQKPVSNFIDYSVFVGFFPLLVAGPIERANHLLPQIQKSRNFNYSQAVEGCRLIVWGMFKKVVIADSLAVIVDEVFGTYQEHNAFTLIIGAIAFSFQIYGDFSGYSDIAIGVAKLFGFELLTNFKFPYFSRDIAEFWRRWHISLSSWFRDYLYIPLGGSKEGQSKAIRNTFIIFLVSGFWHGASWNFIIWGFIHACAFMPLLLLNRNRKHVSEVVAQDKKTPSFKELVQMAGTFAFVTFAWIFFRADSIEIALGYLKRIVLNIKENPLQLFDLPANAIAFCYVLPMLFGDWLFRRDERNLKINSTIAILLCLIIWYHFGNKNTFIYFQF
jgi:alginate O-acetyltransferase complex protein AlgI